MTTTCRVYAVFFIHFVEDTSKILEVKVFFFFGGF